MWVEAAQLGGVVVLIGVITAMQNSKINKSQTKEMCVERHENVEDRLKTGIDRFDKNDKILAELIKAVNNQNITLTKVYTIVTSMERNGHKKEGGINTDV